MSGFVDSRYVLHIKDPRNLNGFKDPLSETDIAIDDNVFKIMEAHQSVNIRRYKSNWDVSSLQYF